MGFQCSWDILDANREDWIRQSSQPAWGGSLTGEGRVSLGTMQREHIWGEGKVQFCFHKSKVD